MSYKRKIQLIAGSTYSISLPKEWVKKNNLKEQKEVLLKEREKELIVSAAGEEEKELRVLTINIDEYKNSSDTVLFSAYYLGIEEITIFSKTPFSKEIKSRLRKTIANMSGTEVSYEDGKKMVIKVLLDKEKIKINQLIYRIGLILDSTFSNLIEGVDMEEVRINENEVDRLYHLIAKIISVALRDSKILFTSEINHLDLIPPYFMIGKRLETMADAMEKLAETIVMKNQTPEKKVLLLMAKEKLKHSINFLKNPKGQVYEKMSHEEEKEIDRKIREIENVEERQHVSEIMRYLVDIEEEVTEITFFQQLIVEKRI